MRRPPGGFRVHPPLAVLSGETAVPRDDRHRHLPLEDAPGPKAELRGLLGMRLAGRPDRAYPERREALGPVLWLVQQGESGEAAEGPRRGPVKHRGGQ